MKTSIKLISFFISLIIFTTSCGSTNSSNSYDSSKPLTTEELKQELLNTECLNGAASLEGALNYSPIHKNILSRKVKGLKLNCTIKNKATLATLNNLKAKVVFKSKTGATILQQEFEINENINPDESIEYKTEITITNEQYKDISKSEFKIISAKCNQIIL